MKNYLKILIFLIGLAILFEIAAYFFIPNKSNLREFGYFNKTKYEILSEPNNTIDVAFLGDSLVYNGISPMYLWKNYGFTSYDCAGPAATPEEVYKYAKVLVQSQKPKLVFLEADVMYRNSKSLHVYRYKAADIKKYFPLFTFHNNWKQISDDEWINPYKGFKYSNKVSGPNKDIHRKKTKKVQEIESSNREYYEKTIKLLKENGIEVIIMENPTVNWNYRRHNGTEKFAKDNDVEVIDMNVENLGIDWEKDTKDTGIHMNYLGARKVSKFLGDYIVNKNIVPDHRNDKSYDNWNKAYELYQEKLFN